MTFQIHTFDTSGEAYDHSMIGTYYNGAASVEVKRGDVILVPSEKVAGVVDTWPIAASKECGALHYLRDGLTIYDVKDLDEEVVEGYLKALEYANHLGWT